MLNIRYKIYINEQQQQQEQQFSEHYTRISAQPSKPHHEINADNFKSHNILPEYRDFGFFFLLENIETAFVHTGQCVQERERSFNKCADVLFLWI